MALLKESLTNHEKLTTLMTQKMLQAKKEIDFLNKEANLAQRENRKLKIKRSTERILSLSTLATLVVLLR